MPTTFAYNVYQWPRENLHIDPGTAAVGMFFMLSGFVIPFALERRTLVAFGLRRILRVYPTLWAATALSIFFIWLTTRGQTFPLGQGQVVTSGTLDQPVHNDSGAGVGNEVEPVQNPQAGADDVGVQIRSVPVCG